MRTHPNARLTRICRERPIRYTANRAGALLSWFLITASVLPEPPNPTPMIQRHPIDLLWAQGMGEATDKG